MKFNVEVELDWIHDDTTFDSELKDRIITDISKQILNKFTKDAGKRIAQEAESLIKAKTDLLINTILEKPVIVSNGWNNKKEYPSIFDMVEQKMTALYKGKLDLDGQCTKDPLLANIENVVKQETQLLLNKVTAKIKAMAKEEAWKNITQ